MHARTRRRKPWPRRGLPGGRRVPGAGGLRPASHGFDVLLRGTGGSTHTHAHTHTLTCPQHTHTLNHTHTQTHIKTHTRFLYMYPDEGPAGVGVPEPAAAERAVPHGPRPAQRPPRRLHGQLRPAGGWVGLCVVVVVCVVVCVCGCVCGCLCGCVCVICGLGGWADRSIEAHAAAFVGSACSNTHRYIYRSPPLPFVIFSLLTDRW